MLKRICCILVYFVLYLVLDVPGALLKYDIYTFFCGAIYQINTGNIIVVRLYLIYFRCGITCRFFIFLSAVCD